MNRTTIFVTLTIFVIVMLVSLLAVEGLRWRMQIVAMKASGDLEDLTWSETLRWLAPGSPVYLDKLIVNKNPNISIQNTRYTTTEDVLAGRDLFRQHCVSCHGGAGEGAAGPALIATGRVISDWDMYTTIQRGIQGTAMSGHRLPDPQAWQIMSYIKTLVRETSESRPRTVYDTRPVTPDRLSRTDDEPWNWLTYSGNYSGWRFSHLTGLNKENIEELKLDWVYQAKTTYDKFETTPLVVDGVMFITQPPGSVLALDAATGRVLWQYRRSVPDDLVLCCGVVNRGVAVLQDRLLVATIDAHLLALDVRSGTLLWDTEVADHRLGYSITSAPLAIDGKVITGVGGGETGARGFLAAYEFRTGKLLWRFDTVPAPGASGSESWGEDEKWAYGGAATWMTGSYDSELNMIYWGTSHSVHDPEDVGGGDELYGSSLLAIDADTGELVWYFQATPDDVHGFDAAQVPILVDTVLDNRDRKLLLNANRNGYLYLLDRLSGEFIAGRSFAKQSWTAGLDSAGRPIRVKESHPTEEGSLSWPGSGGATNWWPSTYMPTTNNVCIPTLEMPTIFYNQQSDFTPGKAYVRVVGRRQLNQPIATYVRCFEATSGELVWETPFPTRTSGAAYAGGLLSTAGNLIFASDNGVFYAIDAETGDWLWHINLGGDINAAPMTYAVGKKQFVTIAAGRTLMTFSVQSEAELE